ncbi:MAG: hypothetical protein ACLFUE_07010, partial [Desulfobacteraceae bacterium]
IYAEAFSRDPEFYSFKRSLEVYEETMDEKSTLVLSTDSEFLKYLKGQLDSRDIEQGSAERRAGPPGPGQGIR